MKQYMAFTCWTSLLAISWMLIMHIIAYDIPSIFFWFFFAFLSYATATNIPAQKVQS